MQFSNIKRSLDHLKETEIANCLSFQGLGLGAADIQLMFPGGVKEQDSQSVAFFRAAVGYSKIKTAFV